MRLSDYAQLPILLWLLLCWFGVALYVGALQLTTVVRESLSSQTSLYPLSYDSDYTLVALEPGSLVIQSATSSDDALERIIIPFAMPEDLPPTVELLLSFRREDISEPLDFAIRRDQLLVSDSFSLDIPFSYGNALRGKRYELQIQLVNWGAGEPYPEIYLITNPWMEHHRLAGKLSMDGESYDEALMFRPVYAQTRAPVDAISLVAETIHVLSPVSVHTWATLRWWFVMVGIGACLLWDTYRRTYLSWHYAVFGPIVCLIYIGWYFGL